MAVTGFDDFIPDDRRKIAVLDSNLLVLRITGFTDPGMFKTFERVRSFAPQDFIMLEWVLNQFSSVVTTAFVLAEASNLGNKLTGENRSLWFAQLADYAVKTDEAHVATQAVGALTEVVRFGVTDAALRHLSNNFVVVTSEYRLSGYLEDIGKHVLNFNHLRPLWMLP